MISNNQPNNLPESLVIGVSSKEDGTMLDKTGVIGSQSVLANRQAFCKQSGLQYSEAVFQAILYDDNASYSLVVEVDSRSTTKKTQHVVADALYTEQTGIGLFLPVADCIATVVYDPSRRALALLHMGRHSTLSTLIDKTINTFVISGSDSKNIIVWMSPSAQRSSYKLEYFSESDSPDWQPHFDKKPDGYYVDMQGYNCQRFIDAGVLNQNISISAIDTVTDGNYFSHSAGETGGRFAVVAMMR